MKRIIIIALGLLAAVFAAVAAGTSGPVAPSKAHATTTPLAIIQFGRMGWKEGLKAGPTNGDCTAAGSQLPDSSGVLTTAGTVNLGEATDLLEARYKPTGTNPFPGGAGLSLTGVVNTDLIAKDSTAIAGGVGEPAPTISDLPSTRDCGTHDSSYGYQQGLGALAAGSIYYSSWQDLANLKTRQPHITWTYEGAGENPGGQESGNSPFADNTWTDVDVRNNIQDNIQGEGLYDNHNGGGDCTGCQPDHSVAQMYPSMISSTPWGEMGWPSGGVPGCFNTTNTSVTHRCGDPITCATFGTQTLGTNCPVEDAVNGDILSPEEVARRVASGCVSGAAHTAKDNLGNSYVTHCGQTYPALILGFNRKYSNGGTNGTAVYNAQPIADNCTGAGTDHGCYYGLTWSLVGGKCKSSTGDACATTLPGTCTSSCYGGRDTGCSSPTGFNINCYQRPSDVLTMADNTATHGGIFILQAYRFVTGAYTDTTNSPSKKSWNCTGAVDTHWTQVPETYCYSDFQTILDGLVTDGYHPTTPEAISR